MDSEKILTIEDFEDDSCIDCKFGVIVPDGSDRVDFAKCQVNTDNSIPIFNFNWYGECYKGYLPRRGIIVSKENLPCGGQYFKNRRNN